jgi:hypothetical protein
MGHGARPSLPCSRVHATIGRFLNGTELLNTQDGPAALCMARNPGSAAGGRCSTTRNQSALLRIRPALLRIRLLRTTSVCLREEPFPPCLEARL